MGVRYNNELEDRLRELGYTVTCSLQQPVDGGAGIELLLVSKMPDEVAVVMVMSRDGDWSAFVQAGVGDGIFGSTIAKINDVARELHNG